MKWILPVLLVLCRGWLIIDNDGKLQVDSVSLELEPSEV